jgi:hypothetical protein
MSNSPWERGESYNVNDPLPGLEPVAQRAPGTAPPVVLWYKIYCVFMMRGWLGLLGLGVVLVAMRGSLPLPQGAALASTEMLVRGVIMVVAGLVMFVVNIAALVLPPKPWTWVYHLINLALGGGCILIIIPLLIYWLKPETQLYFGRTLPGSLPNSNTPPPPIPPV